MKKLIVANWKMNGSFTKLKNDLVYYISNQSSSQENIVLALPNIYLASAYSIISENNKNEGRLLKLASQDISQFGGQGAYTGEVSGLLLQDIGVNYVIIGHSERRNLLHEGAPVLLAKLENALTSNIVPIFCIGEAQVERENNQYCDFLLNQLSLLLKITHPFNKLIIAYEPIWSIGTGVIPTDDQIQEIMELIVAFMQKNFPHVKIITLYGGSVSGKNADKLLNLSAVDGVLVGGASLNPDDFIKICRAS